MQRRHGFTLVEVLVATTVLVIALLGLSSAAFNALKKASTPDAVDAATLLAAERLEYFRAQTNPYRAVGGTYFQPPMDKTRPDLNAPPSGDNVNIVVGTPCLFVREYLHAGTDKQFVDNQGPTRQAQRMAGAANSNFVPDTPNGLAGVVPNNDLGAAPTNTASFTVAGADGQSYAYQPMTRANCDLYLGMAGTLPDSVKFVREVWVQTNNPYYGNALRCPNNLLNAGTFANPTAGTNTCSAAPATQPNMPPYVVAVTVRVFARDPQTDMLASAGFGADGRTLTKNPATTMWKGLGYDPRRILAQTVGYFSLRRI